MKKFLLSLILIILSSFMLSAGSSGSRILDLDSPVYGMMDDLYLSSGLASPSGARPWSVYEARSILARVDVGSLGAAQSYLYGKLEKELELSESESFVDLGMDINPEVYYHTNGTDFDMESDWVNDFTSRNPFALIKLEMGIQNILYTYCDLGYGWGRVTYMDEVKPLCEAAENWMGLGSLVPAASGDSLTVTRSYIYSKDFVFNFPDIRMIEINVPRRAVISAGGSHWNLSFAHDRINWGTSAIGNFIVDSHVPYQDYVRLKGFSDKLSMDFVCMFMDTDFSTGNASVFSGKTEYFLLHRFEFRIFPWLSLSLSENVMYKPETFEGKFLNLSYFLHQLNNSQIFNAIASAELEVAVSPGLGAYVQFCLDQAQAPTEDDSQPNAIGWLAGLRGTFLTGNGYWVADAEFAHASPALYRRDYVDFLMVQKYSTNVTFQRPLVFDTIGFPYSGDSQVAQIGIRYNSLDGWNASAFIRGIRKGTIDEFSTVSVDGTDNYTDKPTIKGSTPYGDRYYDTLVVGTGAAWDIPEFWSFLSASVFIEADFIWQRTVQKNPETVLSRSSDIQLSGGVGLSF